MDLNWLKVSHLNSILYNKISSRVLSQVSYLRGRYAVVFLIEKKCLTHLWLFQTEKLKLDSSKAYLTWDLPLLRREKLCTLSDFIAETKCRHSESLHPSVETQANGLNLPFLRLNSSSGSGSVSLER